MKKLKPTDKLVRYFRNNALYIVDHRAHEFLSKYFVKRTRITLFVKNKLEARDWEALQNHQNYKYLFEKAPHHPTGKIAQLVEEGKKIEKKLADGESVSVGGVFVNPAKDQAEHFHEEKPVLKEVVVKKLPMKEAVVRELPVREAVVKELPVRETGIRELPVRGVRAA